MQTLAERNAAILVPLAEKYRRGELRFEESDLIYSATERCKCGAGLAQVNQQLGVVRFWHCSECLLNGYDPSSDKHDDWKPVSRWEIQEEGPVPEIGLSDALSAHYLTTRPNAEYSVYTIFPFGDSQVNTADKAVAEKELWRLASQHGTVHMITRNFVRNG